MNEKYGLYCVATLHPSLTDDTEDEFFTRAEKEAQIKAFYREKQRIPLCIDHCNADTPLFVVPARERIGYVLDLFINRDDAMMVKFRLSNKHPAYKQIYDGITQRRERWGVSVWIDRLQNRYTGQVTKKLTHVALTLDPRFADYNTFTHKYALNENMINTYIASQFYRCGEQKCFAAKEFKRKLWDSARATGVNMSQEHLQQPAFTDDAAMQVEPSVGQNDQQQQQPAQADQQQVDQTANKKVRLDNQPTTTGAVTPLREFDASIDVNKLSGAEIKQQMEEILEHAKELGRTVDKLPVPEQRHYFKLINNLHERTEIATKHMEEMKKEGIFNDADCDIWIDMLKKNDLDPFAKNNIATFAAAGRRYADKKVAGITGERDEALKRAHNAEEELKTLREKNSAQPAMAMGKPVSSSSFSQQISNSAAQQQQPHHNPAEVKVAVTAYYNKFGDKDKANPFARAHSASTTTNSFATALESAILSYGAAQNQPIVNQK